MPHVIRYDPPAQSITQTPPVALHSSLSPNWISSRSCGEDKWKWELKGTISVEGVLVLNHQKISFSIKRGFSRLRNSNFFIKLILPLVARRSSLVPFFVTCVMQQQLLWPVLHACGDWLGRWKEARTRPEETERGEERATMKIRGHYFVCTK